MSDFQLCLCGAAPGYPHAWDCPRPLYHATEAQEKQWEADRRLLDSIQRAALDCDDTREDPEPNGGAL